MACAECMHTRAPHNHEYSDVSLGMQYGNHYSPKASPLTKQCGKGRFLLAGVVLVEGVEGAVLGWASHGFQVIQIAHSL